MSSVTVLGKIFLLGEYSILEGGSAFVAAIKPTYTYFQTTVPTVHTQPESPLGKWYAEFAHDGSFGIEPWSGSVPAPGFTGLGSSTAELIAAWSMRKLPVASAGLLTWYRAHFPKASGADLATQLQAMESGPGVYEVIPTTSKDTGAAGFAVHKLQVGRVARNLIVLKAPDAQKIPTHENLKEHLKVGFDAFKLEFFHEKMRKLLAQDEITTDWRILTEWAQELRGHGLESEYGRQIRDALTAIPGVISAKGCGAGLNDLFIAAVTPDFNRDKFEAIAHSYGLKILGSLHEVIDNAPSVRAFAPVNVAWIKYMGKDAGKPANPSYSITLDHVGTFTEVEVREDEGAGRGRFHVHWNELGYVPPEAGREKIDQWLRNPNVWEPMFKELGYATRDVVGQVRITTMNSAPAGTGIATSASGFAALALAWSACLVEPVQKQKWMQQFESPTSEGAQLRAMLAQAASRGSGSAGRSISGPWVAWTRDHQFVPQNLDTDWVDCILLLDREAKKIPSSLAHERVKTSPLFKTRVQNLATRIQDWMQAFQARDVPTVRKLMLDEAMEMHELFHTSKPSFSYLSAESQKWINLARHPGPTLPSKEYVITLDAGANIHWFVRPKELKMWRTWFRFQDPKLHWIEGKAGQGARYA
ncbi:MAG: hypothetical protein JST80_05760 [Bdellovibrionales bacterium]|nr:hypothetical protein [Bdellovibrionales bacterium]